MVFLSVKIPKKDSKTDREIEGEQFGQSSFKEMSCEVMAQFYQSLSGLYNGGLSGYFTDQDFLSFEYVVLNGVVTFYLVCPRSLVLLIEKQLTAYYPDAYIEQVEDYNLFNKGAKVSGVTATISNEFWHSIKTYDQMTSDPINGIINSLSKIKKGEGAVIQIMIKPVKDSWQKNARKSISDIKSNKKSSMSWYNPLSWIIGFFSMMINGADDSNDSSSPNNDEPTELTEDEIKAVEEKATRPGFETVIRLISTAQTKHAADSNLEPMKSAFTQYNTLNSGSFTFTTWRNTMALVKNFIFRNFKKGLLEKKMILSPVELSSIFHFPNARFNKYSSIVWQNYKIGAAPSNLPDEGLLIGHNIFRGESREVRMKREDRFRHFYVIGQTGTGKSSVLQVMLRQDFQNGDGVCIIDPHGSLIEDVLPFIPRERADDIIYFNPADLERPLGLNLLEASNPEEAELVALDAMSIMIKLFNEEVFGPRIQDYFRNGCLTLMSDPEGGALTDIVRLFTDDDFAKIKRAHITNPVVRSFWDNQMDKTGAREKAEMIPYFAAKFGQFVTNTMMRNIIGQTKSAFDFSQVMQEGKILLMNLSKGVVGEVNSKLLGLIIVQKIQVAALRREKIPKKDRRDFFLYIDEFQNYVTDSIESILSEARKYRLGLNIAHQYLAQLEEGGKSGTNLKDAVFGNVGTIMSYKIGAQDAEHMAKEMAPVFSDQDLVNIDKYKAVMKLSIDTQPSKPFSIIPVNPYTVTGDDEAAKAYKQLSRLKYGRDRDIVSREILRRVGV